MELALDHTTLVVSALIAIALGSICKGITGVGFPVLAVPMIASFTSVTDAVVTMVLPGLTSNLMVVFKHRRWSLLAQHRLFLLCGCLGAFAGVALLSLLGDRVLKALLAAWLGIYLYRQFAHGPPTGTRRLPAWSAALFGVTAGASQGAMGISASLVGPYLQQSGHVKSEYAFLAAFSFLVLYAFQGLALSQGVLFTADRLAIGLLAIIPTVLFTQLGIWLGSRIDERRFTRLLLTVFLLMEIKLIIDISGLGPWDH